MVADLFPHRVAERSAVPAVESIRAAGDINLNKLPRIGDRERAQADGVEEPEDGGVGSGSEGQRQDSDGCVAWRASQTAESVTQIARQILQPASASGIAAVLLGLIDTAQADAGFSASGCESAALANQVLRFHFQVKTDFVGKVRFNIVAPEDAPEAPL
jgi:hypothetical protein